jgi:hypothetical protein
MAYAGKSTSRSGSPAGAQRTTYQAALRAASKGPSQRKLDAETAASLKEHRKALTPEQALYEQGMSDAADRMRERRKRLGLT